MRKLWLAPLLVSVACGSAPIKKADAIALAEADGQVLQGCYDCLRDARVTYARVAVGKARPLVIARLFETDLLITLREKELALDSSAAFREAEALAKELPLTIEAARYLADVDAVAGDDLGWAHQEMRAFYSAHVAFSPKAEAEIQWLKTPGLAEPVRDYLAIAINCGYPSRPRPGQPPGRFQPPVVPANAPPLIAYRVGICRDVQSAVLAKVREDVPRFVETGYFLSRPALVTVKSTGGGNARAWLDEAYKRFPTSPAVTYLTGNFNQLIGDCRSALKFYDETVAIEPGHENAWLGRVMCLTYVKRNDEAIGAATHMIVDLKTDNIDQAYYWRAWNYYLRQDLTTARADIESAKRIGSSTEILTLAGMIEHDQNDLDPAEKDLNAAVIMSGGSKNCTAMWYLGSLYIKRERWLDSGGKFEDALHCYEAAVKDDQDGLDAMKNRADVDEAFKAAQIAGFEAALKEDTPHVYAAAFNAANQYAHGGNLDKARPLLELAARDETLATPVAQLRKIIGGG